MTVIFTFRSLWLSVSPGFLIVWYKGISSSLFCSLSSFFFCGHLCVRESSKKSRFNISWSLLAGLSWSLKYHIISISLPFSISTRLIQSNLKVSHYFRFSSLLHLRESGRGLSQTIMLSQFVFASPSWAVWCKAMLK